MLWYIIGGTAAAIALSLAALLWWVWRVTLRTRPMAYRYDQSHIDHNTERLRAARKSNERGK